MAGFINWVKNWGCNKKTPYGPRKTNLQKVEGGRLDTSYKWGGLIHGFHWDWSLGLLGPLTVRVEPRNRVSA